MVYLIGNEAAWAIDHRSTSLFIQEEICIDAGHVSINALYSHRPQARKIVLLFKI